jgi:anti-sigma factor RsiW
MRHKEIQKQLLLYLDGELPDEEMHQIRDHLSACAVCAQHRDELASVWQSETRSEKVKPSPFLWTRLQARIKEYEQTPAFVWDLKRSMQQIPLHPFPALAVIAAIVVGIYIGTPRGSQRNDRAQLAIRSLGAVEDFGLDQFDVIPPGALGSTLVKISKTQK